MSPPMPSAVHAETTSPTSGRRAGASTSSSLVCVEFLVPAGRRHRTARGSSTQTTRSARCRIRSHVSRAPTGTATTIRAGACWRNAVIAACIVEPVARPSSTRRTVRSLNDGRRTVPAEQAIAALQFHVARAPQPAARAARGIRRSRIRSSLRTSTPPAAIAPMASSGWPGTPSLRTRKTSSGAFSAEATSNATGTPPRGRPNTSTSVRPAYSVRRAASCRPASIRFLKRTVDSSPSRSEGTSELPAVEQLAKSFANSVPSQSTRLVTKSAASESGT